MFLTLPDNYQDRARRLETIGAIVSLPDGTTYTVRNLLTDQDDNLKLAKSGKAGAGFYTVGLSLAPAMLAGMGNVCPSASPACLAGCLNTAGKGLVQNGHGRYMVQAARIAKTRVLLSRDADVRADGVSLLVYQLERAQAKAHAAGLRLAVRLNVLSDLKWETMAPWLFTRFPDVQFYDYTKIYSRLGHTPANYDLTFSRSEVNGAYATAALARGFRVAVVFNNRHGLPAEYYGVRVVNADRHDLRFLDGSSVIAGLLSKGKLKGNGAGTSARGFVVSHAGGF